MATGVAAAKLGGCVSLERTPPVPPGQAEQAIPPGTPRARFFADTEGARLQEEGDRALERERAALGLRPGDRMPPAHFLAVSGGSDNGAFGAGLLVGWTEQGTRPEFKLVTGVSTGALIAPFAFLGPERDAQLRPVYIAIRPAGVFRLRGWLDIPFPEWIADTASLFGLISGYANQNMLDAIAREYDKGRLLLIGTTKLDVMRPVIQPTPRRGTARPGSPRLRRRRATGRRCASARRSRNARS